MKIVKCVGHASDLTEGKEYEVIEERAGEFKVVDDAGDNYWYNKGKFVEVGEEGFTVAKVLEKEGEIILREGKPAMIIAVDGTAITGTVTNISYGRVSIGAHVSIDITNIREASMEKEALMEGEA